MAVSKKEKTAPEIKELIKYTSKLLKGEEKEKYYRDIRLKEEYCIKCDKVTFSIPPGECTVCSTIKAETGKLF